MDIEKNKFRAFFAIDLSKECKAEILNVIKQLQKEFTSHKKAFKKIRWTKPDNLHITLRFLGNISQTQSEAIIIDIKKNLDFNFASSQEKQKFLTIKLAKIIPFPSIYHPRMLVVNLEPNSQLKKIWQILDSASLNNKIAPDNHPFTPHLTLCRFEIINKFPEIKIPEIETANFVVNTVNLYRSDPSETGSNYTLLNTLEIKHE